MGLHGRLLAGIRPTQRLPDLQHGGRLHDLFDPRRIVHAGQLHQNLILPQTVFLNDRLSHAQLVNPVANGLNRLRYRAYSSDRPSACGFMEKVQEFSGPELGRTPAGVRSRWSADRKSILAARP